MRTVPDPTTIASDSARNRWTSARASLPGDPLARAVGCGDVSIEGHRKFQDDVRSPGLSVRDVGSQLSFDGIGFDANEHIYRLRREGPRSHSPAPCGSGSSIPTTTREIPAAMIASVHGPVRPWWLHGSNVVIERAARCGVAGGVDRLALGVVTSGSVGGAVEDSPYSLIRTAPTHGFGTDRSLPVAPLAMALRIIEE